MKAAAMAKAPDMVGAGCGQPIGDQPILKLAGGAVHWEDGNYTCLLKYADLGPTEVAARRSDGSA